MQNKKLKTILFTVMIALTVFGTMSVFANWPPPPNGEPFGGWLSSVFDLNKSGSGKLVVQSEQIHVKKYCDENGNNCIDGNGLSVLGIGGGGIIGVCTDAADTQSNCNSSGLALCNGGQCDCKQGDLVQLSIISTSRPMLRTFACFDVDVSSLRDESICDFDGDGYDKPSCGGTDCNDYDPADWIEVSGYGKTCPGLSNCLNGYNATMYPYACCDANGPDAQSAGNVGPSGSRYAHPNGDGTFRYFDWTICH